jgi:hypothetical protein
LAKKKQRIESPLLKGYLRSAEPYPSYMPTWIGNAGWWTFGILTAVLAIGFQLACVGTAIAGALAFAFVTLMRTQYKPRNDEERGDELVFAAMRKLKKVAAEGNIHKRVPTEVLFALEGAVEAHNAAIARLSTQEPLLAVEAAESVRQSLHTCFLAAASVIRDDEHSSAEWRALQDKSALINEILSAIHERTMQMREPTWVMGERLAALRELDQSEGTHLSITER